MSAPVGAAGVIACSGEPGGASFKVGGHTTLRVRESVSFGWSRSDLVFDEGTLAFTKTSVVAAGDFFFGDRFSLQLASGAFMTGTLGPRKPQDRLEARTLGPGWLGAISGTWTLVKDEGIVPAVVISTTVASARASLRANHDAAAPGAMARDAVVASGSYTGVDFRFGATVAKLLYSVVSPYVSLRVFGGPVFLREAGKTQLGTDRYHVQPAFGAVFLLEHGIDVFAEGSPFFERGFVAGVGFRP